MGRTPSSKATPIHFGNPRTPHCPQSKHRLIFNTARPSPNPNHAGKEAEPPEHPVEVVGRIRDYPDRKDRPFSALHLNPDQQSLRVKTEIGYRDFRLDGVSLSEEEDLDQFYKKFIQSRIKGVKCGEKCTIMMYGPTGSGKSHTMFGCSRQPGIVYRSLKDILGGGDEVSEERAGGGTFVQVTVLEIYNEEIYDLLSSTTTGGGFAFGWSKGSASKVRLEVFGKKVKNANSISGNEAEKISKEIHNVEKRRIVKSTLCNERSSRSHCLIILDVPTVGGRLMLVDMAGSENIEQAGQNGLEAKMQTAKINQGNIALKRVVESIANGDSHVPFRDSKLTMLLQDSFEDDKSKILMILCASPDPKELHKTIFTLEYGAKAKCIVRGPHTPVKEKDTEDSSPAVILKSRIAAMDQFISRLQMENKLREKECKEAQKQLMKKEEEVAALRAKLMASKEKGLEKSEEAIINNKVRERTQRLKMELEKKIQECQNMANEFVEIERRKMEERIFRQQEEVDLLRRRLEEIESQLCSSKDGNTDLEEKGFTRRLAELYSDDAAGMVKSMDLDKSIDMETVRTTNAVPGYFTNKVCLKTVFEEEAEEDDRSHQSDEEVQKEVVEEKTTCSNNTLVEPPDLSCKYLSDLLGEKSEESAPNLFTGESEEVRQKRIQNIFTLCGNYRQQQSKKQENVSVFRTPAKTIQDNSKRSGNNPPSVPEKDLKENFNPSNEDCVGGGDLVEVYVKWEASKENPGKLITTIKVAKESTLADLRKLIEVHLGAACQPFTFLALGDPTGAPVPREEEVRIATTKLPACNSQVNGHLACLRPQEGIRQQRTHHLPLCALENLLPVTPQSQIKKQQPPVDKFSPLVKSSTPFVTVKRYHN
ncbi:unnamed protein product [Cuscuta epithymum]|uniref:Kinesin-like protein KIN-10A n=1 Tax=Cuscuta epithymum TaxID=186058 RepID=A0AAV0EUE6_9ASTE|nr:unnamed protein product [Cuscuta epithymum]